MNLFKKRASLRLDKQKEKRTDHPPSSPASYMTYDIIEKSKEHSKGAYHYKALVQLHDTDCSKVNIGVITAEIQQAMGFHPIGYPSYDETFKEIIPGVMELTWKSWDSCD